MEGVISDLITVSAVSSLVCVNAYLTSKYITKKFSRNQNESTKSLKRCKSRFIPCPCIYLDEEYIIEECSTQGDPIKFEGFDRID